MPGGNCRKFPHPRSRSPQSKDYRHTDLMFSLESMYRGIKSFLRVAFAIAAAGSGVAAATVADFNNLPVNSAPPSGYPIAGFAYSDFLVAAESDAPGFNTRSISTPSNSVTIGKVTP